MSAARFRSISHMKREVTDSGSFWFTPGAISFFGTVFYKLVDGRFLVTEETTRPEGGRYRFVYFEREFSDERYDDVTSDFYETLDEAIDAAREAARSEE